MSEENTTPDNTKQPDEPTAPNGAVDEPKTPPEDQHDQVVQNFVKSAAAAKQIVDTLPENTARQKIFKAVLWAVVSLSATLAVPCGSLAFSYGQEKAKTESETKKKQAEAENVRRKLQLDLLKQIIDVAKKAEFKDPKSVYRLGLIAAMVNENHAAFGIRLIEAEKTMKDMSDRLAPIAGLRRRLTESNILLADLQERYKGAKKEEDDLKTRIRELNTTLKTTKYLGAWRRKKLKRELNEKENELDHQKAQRQFYQERLVTEQKVRVYFSAELKRQEKNLKDALQETATLRARLKKKSAEVSRIATQLQQEAHSAKKTVDKFKKALADMEKDHNKAEQTIKRLRSELASEKQANDVMKRLLKAYSARIEQCKIKDTKKAKEKKAALKKPATTGSRHFRTPRRVTVKVTAKAAPSAMSTTMKRFFRHRRAIRKLYKR